MSTEGSGAGSMLVDEDDSAHYFNATRRLSVENGQLIERIAKLEEAITEATKGQWAKFWQEVQTIRDRSVR